MTAKNEKDIEIGSKVENIGGAHNEALESDIATTPNTKPTTPTPTIEAAAAEAAPTAVVVVGADDAKSTPPNETSSNSTAMAANGGSGGGGGGGGTATAKASGGGGGGGESATSQEQPKQESSVMQPMQHSMAGKMDEDAHLINFKVLYLVAQLTGLTAIILVICLVNIHFGGVGWTANPKLEFNWHPILMTIGLIFLYGNSILIYRGLRNVNKKTLKQTHAAIHLGAFVFTVIALITVFDSHNLAVPPTPNMYTLHSWLGIGTVIVFGLQYVAGFTAYLAPEWRQPLKVAYMPLHIYFGLFGFVLAIATALMGITEKALWAIADYNEFSSAGVMANCLGCLYVIFGALVVYLVTESSYKRKPLPEDTILLTGANQ